MAHMFVGPSEKRYILTQETLDMVTALIAQAIKDGLPEEARRVDVLCFLFDEMKDWVRSQRLTL